MGILGRPPEKPKPHNCEVPKREPIEDEWYRPASMDNLNSKWNSPEPENTVWRCDYCWDLWLTTGGRWIRYPFLTPGQKRTCRKMDRRDRVRTSYDPSGYGHRKRDGSVVGAESPMQYDEKMKKAAKRLPPHAFSRTPPAGPSGVSSPNKGE